MRISALFLALLLIGCGGSGARDTALPAMGVPFQQAVQEHPAPQAPLDDDNRIRLGELVTGFLVDSQMRYGQGMVPALSLSDQIVPMQPGSDYRFPVSLEQGRAYRFVGACDYECRNLDFELLDAAGTVVARDLGANDVPIMDYTPALAGTFTVRLMMQACIIAPCFAGVRVLSAS